MTEGAAGFKLIVENGVASVSHGHGHYHSKMVMSVTKLDELVKSLKEGKSEQECAEIDTQLEAFAVGIRAIQERNLLSSVLSAEFMKKLRDA